MFSILIPTYNKLNYLKLCLSSIKKNSKFNHQIIIHINEGTDGSLEYVRNNRHEYTYSKINEGICVSYNKAASLAKNKYIVLMQDDMYFCPDWDFFFNENIEQTKEENFFLSGTMIQPFKSYIELDCGKTYKDFNEKKLLSEYRKIDFDDFHGTHWQPSLLPLKTWNRVGGLSEEFSPGLGSDPDLDMKLWKIGVRRFKGIGKCRAYHFSSITLRKDIASKNNGAKIFLKKWGITIKFFKKFYLRSNEKYDGLLTEPKKNFNYFFELLICKISLFYLKLLN